MKKQIKIISGLNWGDEGKGLVTNFLSKPESLVVLSSNSSQRGHTVVHKGFRHVFRHFGSGTLKGAATYLTQDFLVNPVMFREEYEKLSIMGIQPKVYCRASNLIVTPYDMLSNQITEEKVRNGSCGCGVWAARTRMNVLAEKEFREKFFSVGGSEFRAGLQKTEGFYLNSHSSNAMMQEFCTDIARGNFEDDMNFFRTHVNIIYSDEEEKELLHSFDEILFENSQGLLLDMEYCWDEAHTTPAHVGARIPSCVIARNFYPDEFEMNAYYISRSYFTRHGNGPMGELGECTKESINPFIEDKTNVPNPWQGDLRYGLISETDVRNMLDRLERDVRHHLMGKLIPTNVNMVVTHTNEYAGIMKKIASIAKSSMREYTFRKMRFYESDNEETLLEVYRQYEEKSLE